MSAWNWPDIFARRGWAVAAIFSIAAFAWLVPSAAAFAQSASASQQVAALNVVPAQQQPEQVVDVLLVLAVDVSFSIDLEELALQREGYAQALLSDEFQRALKEGGNGRIAVTYFEWAAFNDQRVIVPWRLIDGIESAKVVADEIGRRRCAARRARRFPARSNSGAPCCAKRT